MANNANGQPKQYYGVTVSSTFDDLKEHRAALIRQIDAHDLKSVGMEHSSASFNDVIDSSLQMVRDGAAYIGVIAKKYGQVPECATRNPGNLSITELEFNEALRLNRPILLFIMGKRHLVMEEDVEIDPVKRGKLKAFTARAKQKGNGSAVHRVYAEFDSVEDFEIEASKSLAIVKEHLENNVEPKVVAKELSVNSSAHSFIPQAPVLYAVPPYIGSHKFVGRDAEMRTLDDWAKPADSDSILLFEAIGGNGKSMLTWEWVNNRAGAVRKDWAGVFWYSFYEKGSIMADFCRHALSYMTGQSIDDFKKMKTPELRTHLLPLLNARPWLVILDGLERVLVAYNRIDAAEAADEDMDNPDDKIVNRDPCACINVEDDELLRLLTSAKPSKILISSRLPPKALINKSNQHLQGVNPVKLKGLLAEDAEKLLRICGVTGDSAAIQEYLTANCGNHPLTIGVLAGLINNYLPARGDFDIWGTADDGGRRLNFADLDLVQRRNHILAMALHELPDKEKQLLCTLALMSEAVDYKTLTALNPYLPQGPAKADETRGLQSKEYKEASGKLQQTVRNLEQRGLLQYDHNSKRYDLHPVVRHVSSGGLKEAEKQLYGQQVVDFFTAQAHNPYEQAENIADVVIGINLVRTLLKMGRYKEAYNAYYGDLGNALVFNLEAHQLTLALIRPFFTESWDVIPSMLRPESGAMLANNAAIAFYNIGEYDIVDKAYGAIITYWVREGNLGILSTMLRNVARSVADQNRLAADIRIRRLALAIAELNGKKESLFMARLRMFSALSRLGRWDEADVQWELLDPMGRGWSRFVYRLGEAERYSALHQFRKGVLGEQYLLLANHLAKQGRDRAVIRDLQYLQGRWCMENKNWNGAIESFAEAVRLAREAAVTDVRAETWLAYSRMQAGEVDIAWGIAVAEELSSGKHVAYEALAELWLAVGNTEQAIKYALACHKWAWADGEPYVLRYNLNKAIFLLQRLGVQLPVLPPYDASKEKKYPWEREVEQIIEREKKKKEAGSSR